MKKSIKGIIFVLVIAAALTGIAVKSRQKKLAEEYAAAQTNLLTGNTSKAIERLTGILLKKEGYGNARELLAYANAYDTALYHGSREEVLAELVSVPEDYDGDMAHRIRTFRTFIEEKYEGKLSGADYWEAVEEIPTEGMSDEEVSSLEAQEQQWEEEAQTVIETLEDPENGEKYGPSGYVSAEAWEEVSYEWWPPTDTYERCDTYYVTVTYAEWPAELMDTLIYGQLLSLTRKFEQDIRSPYKVAQYYGKEMDKLFLYDHIIKEYGSRELHVTFVSGENTYYFLDPEEYEAITGCQPDTPVGYRNILINGELQQVYVGRTFTDTSSGSSSSSKDSSSGSGSSSKGSSGKSSSGTGLSDPDDYEDGDDFADDAWGDDYDEWDDAYEAWEDN